MMAAAPEMRPHARRLGHRKSRNGCVRCKARHVKCDEKRPCSNCIRYNLTCSLVASVSEEAASAAVALADEEKVAATPAPVPASALTPEAKTVPAVPSPAVPPALVSGGVHVPAGDVGPLPPTPSPSGPGDQDYDVSYRRDGSQSSTLNYDQHGLGATTELPSPAATTAPGSWADSDWCHHFSPSSMQAMRLLHHYSTVVYRTLPSDPSMLPVWKTAVPEAAFSNEFLMHGLLAVSALHYASTHPEQQRRFAAVSSRYQNLALQYFAANVSKVSEDNFEPFFLCATFIFILTICSVANPLQQRPQQQPHEEEAISLQDVAQSFVLLQGVRDICAFKPAHAWNRDGPLAPMLTPLPPPPPLDDQARGPFGARVEKLLALARQLSPSFDAVNLQSACILAVESLRTTYRSCMTEDLALSSKYIWFWGLTLTQMFIDLIRSGHPVALVILAHYAALARPHERIEWINRGWSANVMALCDASLDEQWQEWLDWPKTSIREEIHVDDMEN